ncbi:hypothetical protein U1Q18_029677 [Sarracenia purpurea var. burkii]
MMVSAAAQFIRCSAIPSMGLGVAARRGGCTAQRGGWFRRSECSAQLSSLIQFVRVDLFVNGISKVGAIARTLSESEICPCSIPAMYALFLFPLIFGFRGSFVLPMLRERRESVVAILQLGSSIPLTSLNLFVAKRNWILRSRLLFQSRIHPHFRIS